MRDKQLNLSTTDIFNEVKNKRSISIEDIERLFIGNSANQN